MSNLTVEQKETNEKTQQHIDQVIAFMVRIAFGLGERAHTHDKSKMRPPELDIFAEYTSKLATCTYGSEEYKQNLAKMKPALDHHYAKNRHHPEHFKKYVCNGCFKVFAPMPSYCDVCGYSQFQEEPDISQMNLIDVIEMVCDWYAATKRHNDGDIWKSIEINAKRFRMEPQLVSIIKNTVHFLNKEEW